MTPRQIRAARGLLGWSAQTLAERSSVHISTVQRMEKSNGELSGTLKSFSKVKTALEVAGIEFLGDDGWCGVLHREIDEDNGKS